MFVKDRRQVIGLYALALLTVAAVHLFVQPSGYAWRPLVAACVRVGVMLFLVWLAYPDLKQSPPWLWASVLAAAVLVAWRPRLAAILIPVAVVIQVLRKQTRSPVDKS